MSTVSDSIPAAGVTTKRSTHSLCLGVYSFVGKKNYIPQKSPYDTWLWRWNWAFSQSGLGCVVDICYFCLLIIILRLVTTSNISFEYITPTWLSVHVVKVGAIPFPHHGHVTQAWPIRTQYLPVQSEWLRTGHLAQNGANKSPTLDLGLSRETFPLGCMSSLDVSLGIQYRHIC